MLIVHATHVIQLVRKISFKFPAANTVNTVWTELTRFHANYMIFMATSSVTLVGRRNRKVSGSRCQSLQQQLLNNAVTTDRTSQRRSKFRSAASTEPVPPRSRAVDQSAAASSLAARDRPAVTDRPARVHVPRQGTMSRCLLSLAASS